MCCYHTTWNIFHCYDTHTYIYCDKVLLSVIRRTNLLVHLHHGVGEGVHPSCGTPHRVGGQTMVEDRTQICTVYRLELVVIRIAAERE